MKNILPQIAGALIVSIAVFVITLPFKNRLEQLTELATSIEGSANAITKAANIDPNQISEVSEAVKNGSEQIAEGLGQWTD